MEFVSCRFDSMNTSQQTNMAMGNPLQVEALLQWENNWKMVDFPLPWFINGGYLKTEMNRNLKIESLSLVFVESRGEDWRWLASKPIMTIELSALCPWYLDSIFVPLQPYNRFPNGYYLQWCSPSLPLSLLFLFLFFFLFLFLFLTLFLFLFLFLSLSLSLSLFLSPPPSCEHEMYLRSWAWGTRSGKDKCR